MRVARSRQLFWQYVYYGITSSWAERRISSAARSQTRFPGRRSLAGPSPARAQAGRPRLGSEWQ